MVKFIAAIILIGLASMMLCGFIALGPASHTMNHASANTVDHHFSMWTDISTALVSNISTTVASLISIIALAFFLILNSTSLLANSRFAYSRIPIDPDKQLGKRSKLMRWLSLFENSPSLA